MDMTELLAERNKTHGEFKDNASVSQKIKEIMRSAAAWKDMSHFEREALDMIAHKIGRISEGKHDFKDHWDDIAGYAKLVADRVQPACVAVWEKKE